MRIPRIAMAAFAAAALAVPAGASAQSVVVDMPSGSVQRFEVAGPASLVFENGRIVIDLGIGPRPPVPPAPVPPGPGPEPPPVPPGPGPTPPPVPAATGRLWLTMVFDSTAETQEQATTRAELASLPEWRELDVQFRAFEASQEAMERLNLRPYVGKLPSILIQEQKAGKTTANVIRVLDDVAGKDEVVKAVKALRGK